MKIPRKLGSKDQRRSEELERNCTKLKIYILSILLSVQKRKKFEQFRKISDDKKTLKRSRKSKRSKEIKLEEQDERRSEELKLKIYVLKASSFP